MKTNSMKGWPKLIPRDKNKGYSTPSHSHPYLADNGVYYTGKKLEHYFKSPPNIMWWNILPNAIGSIVMY